MPSKTRKPKAAQALPTIPKELIDQFVNGPMSAEAVNAASVAFKKALIERALGAEFTHHLGYASGADKPAAGSLIGVVRQELVPVADRSGYLMVCDSLHMTDNVRRMLEIGNWSGLDNLTNHTAMPSPDFVPMTSQLKALSAKNLISREALQDMTLSTADLDSLLKQI